MNLSVFMYHRILPQAHPDAISIPMFLRQLDYLQSRYRILTPEELESILLGNGTNPYDRPAAALTFDDGWLDNWLYATPILQERKLRAIVAVSANYLGNGEIRDTESEEILRRSSKDAEQAADRGDTRPYLNRTELKAMTESGCWRAEAHGCVHRKGEQGASLLACPQKQESREEFSSFLRNDVLRCGQILKEITGSSPNMFFWPWGHHSDLSAEIVREAGYPIQFSTEKGAVFRKDAQVCLPRIGVSPKWPKFRRNCITFRHPALARIHDLFHTNKVHMDCHF